MAIFEGFLVGLMMVIFIGPVFFTLLQSTFKYGSIAGFAVAFGIFISDVIIVAFCRLGANSLVQNPVYHSWLAILGSLLLFFLGVKYIFKPDISRKSSFEMSKFSVPSYFIKGFVVNFVNPFVFVVWLSTITYAEVKYVVGNDSTYFLIAALFAILFTDSLKVYFAAKLFHFLKPEILKKIQIGIGFLLIGFGCRLLYYFFTH